MSGRVTVGVVGGGRATPLASIFAQLPDVEVRWLCDRLSETRRSFSLTVPGARCTSDLDELLDDDLLDAVVVDEPSSIQHTIASRALAAEKHVFVADVLAPSSHQADELSATAERRELALMVGSRGLLFDPAVRKLRELIELSRLGRLLYLESSHRIAARDVSFDDHLWRIAATELALLTYLIDDDPLDASACGERFGGTDAGLLACYLRFSNSVVALLRLSRVDALATHDLRAVGSTTTGAIEVLGRERLLTLQDVDAGSQLGPTRLPSLDLGAYRRRGIDPRLLECEHFAAAVRSGGAIRTGVREAAAVSAALDALRASLEDNAAAKPLQTAMRPATLLRLPPPGARPSWSPVGAATGPDPT